MGTDVCHPRIFTQFKRHVAIGRKLADQLSLRSGDNITLVAAEIKLFSASALSTRS